MNNRSRFG